LLGMVEERGARRVGCGQVLRMNEGAPFVDREEKIKWCDALDLVHAEVFDHAKFLQLARECRHPDAQWFSSLFPAGVAVSREQMREVLLKHRKDPRALYVAWKLASDESLLQVAALMCYAPAQAHLASFSHGGAFQLAVAAAAKGDRRGISQLAYCYRFGWGCGRSRTMASDLYREAAELECGTSAYFCGELAFGEFDLERYEWWLRASRRGFPHLGFDAILRLLPSFEEGEHGRILHVGAQVVRAGLAVPSRTPGGTERIVREDKREKLLRLVELHEAMLGRATQAIACWSIVGRRCGVVKDIRLMIAKMAWAELWQWGTKEHIQYDNKKRRT
jgi:hypothetical protein